MPGGDGTGPRGKGPMTGGGLGRCAEGAWPNQGNDRPRQGRGRGRGRGFGRGFGRGLAQRMGFGRNRIENTSEAP